MDKFIDIKVINGQQAFITNVITCIAQSLMCLTADTGLTCGAVQDSGIEGLVHICSLL